MAELVTCAACTTGHPHYRNNCQGCEARAKESTMTTTTEEQKAGDALSDAELPEPYATLHHDDGYFTRKERDDGRNRPWRTKVYTAEQISAVLAADRAKRAVPVAWQPIETAPKDGTAFRGFSEELIDLDFNPGGSVECAFDGENFIGCVWNGQQDAWYGKPVTLTHWQPIPAAPGASSPPASATERAPLTPDEIDDIWAAASSDHDDTCNIHALVEAVEKHHGITTGDTNEQ